MPGTENALGDFADAVIYQRFGRQLLDLTLRGFPFRLSERRLSGVIGVLLIAGKLPENVLFRLRLLKFVRDVAERSGRERSRHIVQAVDLV